MGHRSEAKSFTTSSVRLDQTMFDQVMAERAVQEAKRLLKKCPFSTVDFCAALLEWWNSLHDQRLKSPLQRLMGRLTGTLLPVLATHLQPRTVCTKDV